MQKGLLAQAWLRHIAVAVAYGFFISLFRDVTFPHYVLICGVHVAVLLLMPYRYWPALILGEAVSLLPMVISCEAQFGLVWSIVRPIPGILFCCPVVYYAREHAHLLDRRGGVRIGVLLVCALVISVLMVIDDVTLMSVTVYPANYRPPHYDHLAAQWLLGNYLGFLTVVPTVLAVRQGLSEHGWREWVSGAAESRIVFESVCITVPILALLLWIGFETPHVRGIVQIAMFLPVVWLALRHGWQGAAVGGTAASVAVVVLMPERYDFLTIQAEAVIAFAISTMLLVGARITVLDRRAQMDREDMRIALALAQRNVHIGEMQLRMTSQALEQVRETVRSGFAMMLGRLRHLQPAIDDGGYQRIAFAAQEQLYGISDSLHPVAWRERGLPAALNEGVVARMLDHAGIRYWCDFRGPISSFSSTLHLALYRMVSEAVAEGLGRKDVSDVCVRVRGGTRNGRRGIVVSIVFSANPMRLPHVRWNDLFPRLVRTTSGLGLKALKDLAATFEGQARERHTPEGRRISFLLMDS